MKPYRGRQFQQKVLGTLPDNCSTENTFKYVQMLLDIKFQTSAPNDPKMTLKPTR